MDIYEALTVADIISDHVTEPRELEGAMGRLKRAWPEFEWTYSQRSLAEGGSRRAISIDTRNLPKGDTQ